MTTNPAGSAPLHAPVRPLHGSAEEFATSEDPHCKDGAKACIDCLMRGECLISDEPQSAVAAVNAHGITAPTEGGAV